MSEYRLGYDRAADLLLWYKKHEGLEGDTETILWHLLGDLVEFCESDYQNMDFDAVLKSVREHLKEYA